MPPRSRARAAASASPSRSPCSISASSPASATSTRAKRLHHARLSPLRKAVVDRHGNGQAEATRPSGSLAGVKAVLNAAIRRRESPYGSARFRVYEREGETCLRKGCGGTIRRITQAGAIDVLLSDVPALTGFDRQRGSRNGRACRARELPQTMRVGRCPTSAQPRRRARHRDSRDGSAPRVSAEDRPHRRSTRCTSSSGCLTPRARCSKSTGPRSNAVGLTLADVRGQAVLGVLLVGSLDRDRRIPFGRPLRDARRVSSFATTSRSSAARAARKRSSSTSR